MKKILFCFFAIFSLFFINDSVFATTDVNTLTFTREDFLELYQACADKYGLNLCSEYRYRHVVYISGLDQEFYDIQQGYPQNPPVIQLFMARNYVNWHSDGVWTTFDNRKVNKGYLEVGDGIIITKNLNTGQFSFNKFPGGGSYPLGPMETYSKNWLFLMTDMDIEYNGKVLFDRDNNYDVSGSIQTGSGVIDNVSKTLIERIWDTLKGIFNAIISIPQKIVDFIRELFEDIVGGLALVDKDLLNQFLDELNNQLKNNFGFIYDVFDIIFDILNRFINISSGSHIINIPEIKEPISGGVIINSYSFNFDEVLNKYNIVFLHELYLSFVDVWVLIALINFGRKQYFRMFGGNL